MYTSLLPLSLLLALTTAQTTLLSVKPLPSPGTAAGVPSCDGLNVLNACLTSTTAIAQSCAAGDYQCLCQKWKDVAQCYSASGCPTDPRFAGANSNQLAYCQNASLYANSTPKSTSAPVSSSVTAETAFIASSGSGPSSGSESGSASATGSRAQATATTAGSGSSRTSTSSSSTSTETGAGTKNMIIGMGGVVVGLAGFVAALF
ncbi:hypothetical protein B0O99DRAFT_593686 [Bisporella sp. PMI_857]|nr:hypothetical protein B0O99DRAFT_593686 [Bisporella sp. PMI_857]